MQVTRALEYANRAVVLLATNYGKDPMLVADIAKATAAPPKFLHQVLQMLARAGVLVSRRGAKRGYSGTRCRTRSSSIFRRRPSIVWLALHTRRPAVRYEWSSLHYS